MDSVCEMMNADRAGRLLSVTPVPVYELEGRATELLPPGSGVVLIADRNLRELRDLEEAIEVGDKDRVDVLVSFQKEWAAAQDRLDIEGALGRILETPVYGDLRYGGKVIATNLFAPSADTFTRVFFPYAGGNVDPSGFTFASYGRELGATSLRVVVAVHAPRLEQDELALVNQLPLDAREMMFGVAGGPSMATPAALVATVTAGVLVATVGTALGNCAEGFDDWQAVVNPAIGELAPQLAVHELIQARQELLARDSF